MRRFRMLGAAVSLAALVGAAVAAGGPAVADTNGVGTTQATTTGVNVSLGSDGSLLNLSILSDNGAANIDPKQGSPSSAASALSPLTSTSSVSALNLSLPKIGVSTNGAPNNKTVPSIDLTTPLTTGTINPLSLSSVVDSAQGAAAGLNSTINNLSAVGGLLSVPVATSSLGAAAKPGDSDGLRGVNIPSIQVLNLGAVLQGLGVNPANLTAGQLGGVLSTLQTTINSAAGTLTGGQLTTLANLQSLLTTPPLSLLPGTTLLTDPAIAPVLSAITGALPGGQLPAGITTLGGLSSLLTGAFTNAVNAIASAPLLQLNNLVIGVTTKAADTVANSVATINASLGSIQVGGQLLTVPGLDVASVLNTAQTTINQVLTQAGLGNLLTIKALDQSKSVGSQNGYVNSLANLTGIHVAIAPLSSLAGGAATAQDANSTIGQILGSGNVPALSSAMATLNGLLQTTGAGALTDGATVDVAQVGAVSTFTPSSSGTPTNPSAPTPQTGTLATTGGPTQLLGFVGLLLLAAVVGLRWLRRPVTSN
ncbi:MAG: hypothetical protein JO148_10840 [Acidimicrobiia bacterium]|nr:hypothetical protein [Acidimicrobiia bacterium]